MQFIPTHWAMIFLLSDKVRRDLRLAALVGAIAVVGCLVMGVLAYWIDRNGPTTELAAKPVGGASIAGKIWAVFFGLILFASALFGAKMAWTFVLSLF